MTEYLATLNGSPVKAKKVNGRWMVGGDFDTSGNVQIILDVNGRPAWHTLRGFVLKFSDFATPEEIERVRGALQ